LSSTAAEERPTPILSYDPEWLSITRAFHPLLSHTKDQESEDFPDEKTAREMVWREGVWVKENVYGIKEHSQSSAETETVNREEGKECGPLPVPPPWIGLHDLEIGSVQKFEMVAPAPDSKLLELGKRIKWGGIQQRMLCAISFSVNFSAFSFLLSLSSVLVHMNFPYVYAEVLSVFNRMFCCFSFFHLFPFSRSLFSLPWLLVGSSLLHREVLTIFAL
jgi:hypothetical protein